MRYMVSFKLLHEGFNRCGNKSFDTVEDMERYISDNSHFWESFGRWCYKPNWRGVSDLVPM